RESMGLERVVELLREQWADRRVLETGSAIRPSDAALVTGESLSFVTSLGVLFPEWPLVSVQWRIERLSESSGQDRFMLVYEERRILSPGEPELVAVRDERGRALVRRMVMIDGSAELAWQRFGRIEEDLDGRGDDGRDARGEGQDAPDSRAEDERSDGSGSGGGGGRTEAQRPGLGAGTRAGGAVARGGVGGGEMGAGSLIDEMDMHRPDRRTDLSDPDVQRWRAIEPGYAGRIPAIRLVGFVPPVIPASRTLRLDEQPADRRAPIDVNPEQQEAFACVLIVAGSP
ncbi:MAG: hypothetical protein ACTS3F_09960, partial [Phycisphaerales bacterium]